MTAPDRLTCHETFQRLDDYLGRALTADDLARVQAHLDDCAVCAAEYGFETRLVDGLREKLRRTELPGELRGRLAALLAAPAGPGCDGGAGGDGGDEGGEPK